MKKVLGLVFVSLSCCCVFEVYGSEMLVPGNAENFVSAPAVSQQKTTLQKMSQDTRDLVQAAFQQDQQKPVNLLVQVVENPYAVPSASGKNTDGTGASDNSTTGLSGFLSDPGQTINNLFSPTGAIGQVGVGLTVHF